MQDVESGSPSGLSSAISATTEYVKAASATDLAAAFAFPLAFIAGMVFFFRKSKEVVRAIVFITLLVIAAAILAFVLYDNSISRENRERIRENRENSSDQRLASLVDMGCVPFHYAQFEVSIPSSVADRFDAMVRHMKTERDMGRHFNPKSDEAVVITGYVEPAGTREYLLALSDRRAMAAKNYLSKNFNIDERWFITMGYGKERDDLAQRAGQYMCGASIDWTPL